MGISYRVRHPGVSFRLLADIELQLPALLAVSAQAPKFKRTDFGNLAVEMNGYGAAFTAGGFQSSPDQEQQPEYGARYEHDPAYLGDERPVARVLE